MNGITIAQNNLPTTFEDVAAFAVVAQEKLKSVNAEISAIKRLGLAQFCETGGQEGFYGFGNCVSIAA